ncbi:epoxyqueuosine reductase QueH [Desulfobulbus alkaliphilus]|uniref:epoxyqueuosine reductase QueH n=1 Tax=Desulfobulbus alkaliphilus TaxID=869814 RepID=UPI0019651D1F|nr:epoxyqueuosine reductase QueH [Desulfobulbus alkaliphilus]MBM9536753.1 epoxyqueuosine reductase QueH [Desulfobulbus alkaliphilus]
MRILLHICCGPCALYPIRQLRQQGHAVTGLFYNPNIHPYQEFRRRIEAVKICSENWDFPVDIDEDYGLGHYLRQVVFHEEERCSLCYAMRLRRTAAAAVAGGFEAFTTTLLYSRYQNHQLLVEQCEQWAREYGSRFYYQDFRLGWQWGIDQSMAMGLYRQPYCGCIYSEQERYDKRLRKARAKAKTAGGG